MEQIVPLKASNQTTVKGGNQGHVTETILEMGQIEVEREVGIERTIPGDRPNTARHIWY